MYTKVLDFDRRVLRKDHDSTGATMHGLALDYWLEGKYGKAEAMFTQAIESSRHVLGEDYTGNLRTVNRLAELYEDRGMHTKAESLLNKALQVGRRRLGASHPTVVDTLTVLGLVRMGQMKYVEAEPLLRQTLAYREKTLPDQWTLFRDQSTLGDCLLGQKIYAASEPLLLSGFQGLKERESTMPALRKKNITEARARLVRLYDAWEKPKQAATWRNGSADPKSG
jgi:eukaryotic-like serine/threonine-protein kinase